MKKIYSSDGSLAPVVCLNRYQDKWAIRWNRETVEPEEGMEEEDVQYSYLQEDFDHKPTLQEIKDVVLGLINKQTDEKILSGFVWNGKPVWLSEENQKNFSEAQRVAMMTEGQSLPVKFKLGEDENGEPVYHTFQQLNTLTDFYMAGVAFINQCLQEGWQRKDSIDWEPYEAALAAQVPNE